MYKFTIEEIERAFDDWAKSCGVSNDALADAWHAMVIRLGIIAAVNAPQDRGSAGLHPTTGQGMPAGGVK